MTCKIQGRDLKGTNAHRILDKKPEQKKPSGRPRRRWYDVKISVT